MTHIAFIGLGNMGGPMAANLVKAGHTVYGFDLSAAALAQFGAAGGQVADSVSQAVAGAGVVISMLPASQHVASLYLGPDGLLARLSPGTLVIDCSTIAADTARQVAQAASAAGLSFLDAPVSGGTAGAAAGTLTFMIGGEAAKLEAARPLLACMGKNLFHAGGPGAGQTAKVCNNMLLGILMAGTAEALALGVANGLDPAVLSQIMHQSSGSNWVLERYNPWPGVMATAPASRDYRGGFMSELMLKDLRLASDTARHSQAANPMGQQAQQLFETHVAAGKGQLDFSSIVQQFSTPPAPV